MLRSGCVEPTCARSTHGARQGKILSAIWDGSGAWRGRARLTVSRAVGATHCGACVLPARCDRDSGTSTTLSSVTALEGSTSGVQDTGQAQQLYGGISLSHRLSGIRAPRRGAVLAVQLSFIRRRTERGEQVVRCATHELAILQRAPQTGIEDSPVGDDRNLALRSRLQPSAEGF